MRRCLRLVGQPPPAPVAASPSARSQMEKGKPSRTAEFTAAVRAAHLLYDRPLLFEDPFAVQLTSATWRVICENRLLHWLVMKKILGAFRPLHGQILARSRYAEDQLDNAISAGMRQYVLIGAGLDSFALRRQDLIPSLKVYELDHPATQMMKRKRLNRLRIPVPPNLEFVPVDLERETIAEGLAKSSHSPTSRTFFSWLGTTLYLSRETVLSTLRSVATYATPGSELVFDYRISDELLSANAKKTREKIRKFTARRGEPLKSTFDPSALLEEASRLGFEVAEHLSPEEQWTRYFAKRNDGLRPIASSSFLHLRIH
jgi:methyltransferase (TIGR00027 family)